MPETRPDVWMPLLIDRYLGDTAMLTTEQSGAYLHLLMTMWKAGGTLPDDDGKLAQAAKLSPTRWRGMRDTIRAYFRSDGAGGLVQKRLTVELRRAEQRVEAGKNGARKRWRNGSEGHGERHGEPGSEPGGEPHGETMLPTQTPTSIREPDGSLLPVGRRGLDADASIPRRVGEAGSTVTPQAGEVCRAMKAAGVPSCNPSNVVLRALIAQGAQLSEFISAAEKAVESGAEKPFAYALRIVESERRRAAAIHLAPAAPARKGSMAEFNQQLSALKGQT